MNDPQNPCLSCVDCGQFHCDDMDSDKTRFPGFCLTTALEEEQVEVYPDVIYAAHSPEEFERMCVKAVQEPPGWASRRRREHGESAAWSQRSAQVSLILNTAGLL